MALEAFAKRIEAETEAGPEAPRWHEEQLERYNQEWERRQLRFQDVAEQLLSDVIEPRLKAFIKFFPFAAPRRSQRPYQIAYTIDESARFPASATLEFTVDHDPRMDEFWVQFAASIEPMFVQFTPRDELRFAWSDLDEGRIASWVEDQLAAFARNYVQLEPISPLPGVELVTDPVCGRRIAPDRAVAVETHHGRECYFCSMECQQKFASDPSRYTRATSTWARR